MRISHQSTKKLSKRNLLNNRKQLKQRKNPQLTRSLLMRKPRSPSRRDQPKLHHLKILNLNKHKRRKTSKTQLKKVKINHKRSPRKRKRTRRNNRTMTNELGITL